MQIRYTTCWALPAAVALMLSGCAADKPSPFRLSKRPSLRYIAPCRARRVQKYAAAVGVTTVRDRRLMPFYGDRDGFFREDIPAGLSDMLCAHLRASGVFADVKRIPEPPPDKLTEQDVFRLKVDYGVDMILICDITHFNLLREKMARRITDCFKITLDVGLFCQLVYLDDGTVIWAEQVRRQSKSLAPAGAPAPAHLANLTANAWRAALSDMHVLLLKTGKTMILDTGGRKP